MAKKPVLTRTIKMIDAEGKFKDFRAQAEYDVRANKFFVRVPLHLFLDPLNGPDKMDAKDDDTITLGATEHKIYGDSPVAAIEAVEHAVVDFTKSLEKKRKVIVYMLAYRKDESDVPDCWDHLPSGTVVQIDWRVCWEYTTHDKVVFSSSPNSPYPSFDADDWKVIEWTAQREKFMEAFQLALDSLILRVESFLGDEKTMIEFMDRGRVPLLTGPEKK